MVIMEKSPNESMSGDTKDNTEKQLEVVKHAIDGLDTDVNLSDKLERLVQDYKAKLKLKPRQNLRQVPPPIISEEWKLVRKDIIEKLQPSFCNIFSSQLSDLNRSQLRLFLLSLAIFPENSIIKKRSLIYWWIGEGLVFPGGDKTAKQVGEEVYNELLKQGLIEPDDNDRSPLMNRCKMNPLIHYMLISVAEEAGFFFPSKDNNTRGDLRNCSLSSSHLRLIVGGEDSRQYEKLAEDEEVSTVFNVNKEYLNLPHHWLSKMRKLNVLQLGRWQHLPMHHIEVDDQKFLDELGVHHKHLKFLSLRGISRITSLPDSIVQLINLEILDLRACHNLEKLPEDIGSLEKLTHLDVPECYLIERMPKGTEKLSALQFLKGFVVGTTRKNPCTISNLKNLNKLRRLSIYIGRGAARWEEQFESLNEVASLRSLTISWGAASQEMREINSFLPRQLEKLELIGIPVESIPKWLMIDANCANPKISITRTRTCIIE